VPPDAPGGLCPNCLANDLLGPEEPPPFEPTAGAGSLLGDYELIEEIARGGMGIVFRARQRSLGRTVALKLMMPSHGASPEFLSRFQTEATAAASLDHPNIVPIYEVGEHEGLPFFSMRLIEGRDLGQELRQGQLSPKSAALLVSRIARAVHHAHQRGVLHRDLKPSNVLLDADGDPHLTDFGLARLLEHESDLTQSGVLGTPAYMSPEQARGGTARLTMASDVFGLGAILYEMLAAQPPFRAATALETMRKVVEEEPPPLRAPPDKRKTETARLIDRDLETICLKCLAKEPEARYPTALALAEDLERWLAGETILARRASTRERLWRWARRNRAQAALSVVALALLVVVAIGSTAAALRIRTARDETRGQLARMLVSEGNRLQRAGDPLRALPAFVAALDAEPDEGRQAIHRIRVGSILRAAPEPLGMMFLGAPVSDLKLSPDERDVVAATDDGQVVLWDMQSDCGRVLRGPQDEITNRFGEKEVYDAIAMARLAPRPRFRPRVLDTAFSADSQRVAACDQNGGAWVWDRSSGRLLSPTLEHTQVVYRVAFGPDGRWLATAGADGSARIWSAQTWQPLCPPLQHESEVIAIAFSPDGQHLVTGDYRGELRRWSVPSGKLANRLRAHTNAVVTLEFDGKGEQLISASRDASACLCAATSELIVRRRFVTSTELRGAIIDPGGTRILVFGGAQPTRLYDARSGDELAAISLEGCIQARFSGSGERAAIASDSGVALAIDAANGSLATPPLPHGNRVWRSLLNRAGNRLITGDADGVVRCWSLERRAGAEGPLSDMAPGTRAFLSQDGRRWILERSDGWHLADSGSGQIASAALAIEEGVRRAMFTPDNRSLLILSADCKSVRIFNAVSRQQIGKPQRFGNSVVCLALDPSARSILATFTGAENQLRHFDIAGGDDLMPPVTVGGRIESCAFSRDGKLFLLRFAQTLQIRRSQGGEVVAEVHHPASVRAAQFSPDARRVVTACWSGGVEPLFARVWDTTTGAAITPPLPHRDGVLDAAFSLDGKQVVTGGEDAIAQVWDATTGHPVSPPFSIEDGFVYNAALSPDQRFVAIHRLKLLRETLWHYVIVWDTATGQQAGDVFRTTQSINQLLWLPNSREIVGQSEKGEVQRWRLFDTDFPLVKLQTLSQVLTCHHINNVGNVVATTPGDLQQAWGRWQSARMAARR